MIGDMLADAFSDWSQTFSDWVDMFADWGDTFADFWLIDSQHPLPIIHDPKQVAILIGTDCPMIGSEIHKHPSMWHATEIVM